MDGILDVDELERTAKNCRARFAVDGQVSFVREGLHAVVVDERPIR